MNRAYIVTGSLIDVHTVNLDEALPLSNHKDCFLPPMRVRLVVEPLSKAAQLSYQDVIAEIREGQRRRGYKPSTREEVDIYLQTERNSWEE